MARFLVAVWPFAGHYFPLLSVANALRARGHEVAFYSGAKACQVIKGEGFCTAPFRKIDESRIDEIMFSRNVYASRRHPFKLQALLREWLLGTVPGQVEDLSPILARFRPDAIISETSMFAPMLVLRETMRIPVAVFSTLFACILPGRDAPPFGLGMRPPRRLTQRLAAGAVSSASALLGTRFRRDAKGLRTRYGLAPLRVSPTVHNGQMDLYLVPGIPELDYERTDLPPSVHYIGPCLWNRSGGGELDGWLSQRNMERPLIHVTEGTMHTLSPVVLRSSATGLAGLPLDVLMTTGGARNAAEIGLGEVADNIRVTQWVSHAELLPQTDVVVTTGGAGTVMAALAAGVPLVVVPTDWDKPENAQRVVEAGVGLRLPYNRCTPGRLRDAVEHVLAQPEFRARARRMAGLLAQHDGPERAAELLEGLAATPAVRRAKQSVAEVAAGGSQ